MKLGLSEAWRLAAVKPKRHAYGLLLSNRRSYGLFGSPTARSLGGSCAGCCAGGAVLAGCIVAGALAATGPAAFDTGLLIGAAGGAPAGPPPPPAPPGDNDPPPALAAVPLLALAADAAPPLANAGVLVCRSISAKRSSTLVRR